MTPASAHTPGTDRSQRTLGVGTVERIEPGADQVVLTGRANIQLVDLDALVQVRPGALLRLPAGTRTRWTVHEPVRLLDVHEAVVSYAPVAGELTASVRPFRPRRRVS